MKNHSRKYPILVKEIRELEEALGETEIYTMEASAETAETMNYNDRLDGYGYGESESNDCDREYEKDPHFTQHCIDLGEGYRRHKGEPYSLDEYGLRNQYGPVDQYVFRDSHIILRTRNRNNKDKEKEH